VTQYRDPYLEAEGYVRRPKIRRAYSPEAVLESAAEVNDLLGQARRSRQPYDDGADDPVYGPPPSENPFIPTAAQRRPPPTEVQEALRFERDTRPYMPTTAPAATAQPRRTFLDDFVPTGSAAKDEAARQQAEAARPGADAIFRPQPVTGGRPDNVADNVAREVIARAAIAQATGAPDAEELLDRAATVAWQREAATNGNERGDISAPRDYIESWKGQVRAGEQGSPFADMFGRATAATREALANESAARGAQIRAQAPSVLATTNSQIERLTRPQYERLPERGGGYTTERLPERGGARIETVPLTSRQQADDALITRVLRGVQNPSAATGGAPMVIDRSSQAAFMRSFTPAAERALAAKGLPTSLAPILAAIPVNEQGHQREAPGNNYYGIKGRNPRTGASNVSNTWEEEGGQRVNQKAEFRAYDSPEESVADFVQFLEDNPRYASALEIGRRTGDPEQFIRAVHKAGYATDSNWSNQVLSIARQAMPDFPAAESPASAPTGAAIQRMSLPSTGSADNDLIERAMQRARSGQVPQPQTGRGGSAVERAITAATAPVQAAQAGVSAAQQERATERGRSVWELGKLTPNQYSASRAEGLDEATADAVCGPAAAIAFARKMGRNPTMTEAVGLAKKVGWTAAAGMAGPASQLKLLQSMGIPASLEEGPPSAARMIASIRAGNPVTTSSRGHYFVAEGYDPATGKFDFGESARVLKRSGGNSWYTLEEVSNLGMGPLNGALYMDAT
jgi:flagellum-specific peptidoglycan hydrolase FlgJ